MSSIRYFMCMRETHETQLRSTDLDDLMARPKCMFNLTKTKVIYPATPNYNVWLKLERIYVLVWIALISAASVFPQFFFFFLVHCSRVPQTPLFINFFIKNGSHSTIHTFKNYFATVFSVFSFQFQQNKFYPNRP